MRYIRVIKAILFILPILFASCSEDLEGYMVNGNYLKIGNTDNGILNFSDDVTSRSVTITSKGTWNITSKPEWLEVLPSSGDGTTTVSVKVIDYPSSDESRSDTIKIVLDDLVSKVVAKQAASAYKFTLSTTSLEFGANDIDAKIIKLTTNSSWTIVNNKGWCDVEPQEGKGNAELTISCKENTTGANRENIIEIKTSRDTIPVSINQSGNKFYLKTSPKNLANFARTGGSQDLQILSNTDWTVISSDSWCTVSQYRGSGDQKVIVSATKNTLTTSRNATITISWADEELDINVTQDIGEEPYIKIVQNSQEISSLENENTGGTQTFTVQSNIEWSIESSDDSWCHIETPSGTVTGNREVKVKVDVNPAEASERTCSLKIKSSWFENKTITVHQKKGDKGYVRVIKDGTETNKLSAKPQGETLTFDIESNLSNWTVSSNKDWCVVNTLSGSFNGTISLVVGLNSGSEARDAIITIKSAINDVTVTVHQEPKAIPGGGDNPDPSFSRKR